MPCEAVVSPRLAYWGSPLLCRDAWVGPTRAALKIHHATDLGHETSALYSDENREGRDSQDACIVSYSPDTQQVVSLQIDDVRVSLREGIVTEHSGGEDWDSIIVERSATDTNRRSGQRAPTGSTPAEAINLSDCENDADSEPIDALGLPDGSQVDPTRRWIPRSSVCHVLPSARLQRVMVNGVGVDRQALVLASSGLFVLSLPRSAEVDQMAVVQKRSFDLAVSVRAVCMDTWGAFGSIVGFSDGTVALYDWRDPGVVRGGGTPSLSTSVPQPQWLSHWGRGRSRRGATTTTRAGVLSCCAIPDSYRVVCGLADERGAVAVTDLRLPNLLREGLPRGQQKRAEQMFAGVGSVPTGCSIVDMSHCPDRFGVVAMVDSRGEAVLRTIADLEQREVISRKRWDRTEDLESTVLSGDVEVATVMSAHGHGEVPLRPSSVCSLGRRCAFVANGRYLVKTAPFCSPHGGDVELCDVRLPREPFGFAWAAGHRRKAWGYVSVSTVDGIIALERKDGTSLCWSLS